MAYNLEWWLKLASCSSGIVFTFYSQQDTVMGERKTRYVDLLACTKHAMNVRKMFQIHFLFVVQNNKWYICCGEPELLTASKHPGYEHALDHGHLQSFALLSKKKLCLYMLVFSTDVMIETVSIITRFSTDAHNAKEQHFCTHTLQ